MSSTLSTASHRRSIVGESAESGRPTLHEYDEMDQATLKEHPAEDEPVRHLCIDWPSSSIKGNYTIGATARDMLPPLYDMPARDVTEENATSAVFRSRLSVIHVTVNVLHGLATDSAPSQATPPGGTPQSSHSQLSTPQSETPPSTGSPRGKPGLSLGSLRNTNTVFISAKSSRNSVSVCVPRYVGRRPLHIKARSSTGNVCVMLPETFNGMVSWFVEAGTFSMSPGIEERFHRLDSAPGRRHGTAKIVPAASETGWTTANGKRGDVCEISTSTGRLYLCTAVENPRGMCVIA